MCVNLPFRIKYYNMSCRLKDIALWKLSLTIPADNMYMYKDKRCLYFIAFYMPLALKNNAASTTYDRKKLCLNGEPRLPHTYALILSASHIECMEAKR